MPEHCFICGGSLAQVTVRELTVLGSLRVNGCGPCVDLPDTPEFVNALLVERLAPAFSGASPRGRRDV